MIRLEDLQLTATLATSASLSAAARTLNVTPPALSMRLRKLEASLGLALATRTARYLRLTPEGERFAREAALLLAQIEALPEQFEREDKRLTGSLRVAAPFGYGRCHIAPLLGEFALLHPGLQVRLELGETLWHERHDVDMVVHIGRLQDSSWVAQTLAPNERWLCASPAYLAAHGSPKTPAELSSHRCICIRENEEDATLWHYRPKRAHAQARIASRESIRVEAALTSNDGSVARAWAEQGLGVLLRSQWDVEDSIARGSLVRLLAPWQFDSAPVMLLVPTRKGRSARVQALLNHLEERLKPAA